MHAYAWHNMQLICANVGFLKFSCDSVEGGPDVYFQQSSNYISNRQGSTIDISL